MLGFKITLVILMSLVSWLSVHIDCQGVPVDVLEEFVTVDVSRVKKFELVCPTTSDDDIVLWYKKNPTTGRDEELQYSQQYYFSGFNKVEILNLGTRDAGLYTCKSAMTLDILKTFQLNIVDSSKNKIKPPVWTHLPDLKTTVYNKRAAVLPCRAKGKSVEVKAFRVHTNGTTKRLRDSGVVLHRPKASDSGKYRCLAENKGGKKIHDFELVVRVNGGFSTWSAWSACSTDCGYGVKRRHRVCNSPVPANGGMDCYGRKTERRRCKRSCLAPKLVKFGYDLTSGDLVLNCVAKGVPTPSVQWKFGGYDLDARFGSRTDRAVIPKRKIRSGVYGCTVRNDAGYFTTDITITL